MPPTLIQLPSPWASAQLDYGAGRIKWWSFRETTGTTSAVFDLYDGTSAAVNPLLTFSLGPGESTRDFVGSHLIPYHVGLWLAVTSGTVLGAMQTDDLPKHGHDAAEVVVIGSINIEEMV